MVERVYIGLKDEFGGRFIRVRGASKMMAHLMFGVLGAHRRSTAETHRLASTFFLKQSDSGAVAACAFFRLLPTNLGCTSNRPKSQEAAPPSALSHYFQLILQVGPSKTARLMCVKRKHQHRNACA